MAHPLPDNVRLTRRAEPQHADSSYDVWDRTTGEHLGYVYKTDLVKHVHRGGVYKTVVEGTAWDAIGPDERNVGFAGGSSQSRADAITDLLRARRLRGEQAAADS